jgi:hypothetical protein
MISQNGYGYNVADLVNPDDPQGRTYRQINATKTHKIPLGSLVELRSGVRLFVVNHNRDCDETPLYYLSHDKDDIIPKSKNFRNESWIGGYDEESLTLISEVFEEKKE